MISLSVPEIEGGSPERHGGEGEEGQGWGNSGSLTAVNISKPIYWEGGGETSATNISLQCFAKQLFRPEETGLREKA